jgi:hypothetical protein
MTLIETHPGETDAELRAVADGVLNTLNPTKVNWWHPYELRGTHQRQGKLFREFWCVAGSVEIWLWKLSYEHNLRQVVFLSDGKEIDPAGYASPRVAMDGPAKGDA